MHARPIEILERLIFSEAVSVVFRERISHEPREIDTRLISVKLVATLIGRENRVARTTFRRKSSTNFDERIEEIARCYWQIDFEIVRN